MMPAAGAGVKEVASRKAIEREPPDRLLVVVQPSKLPDTGEEVCFGVLEGRRMRAVRIGSCNEGRACHQTRSIEALVVEALSWLHVHASGAACLKIRY